MEAATPLRQPSVRVLGARLAIDGLLVDDPCAVRVVADRVASGGDAVRLVEDALEIGARVLDREQAGATAELFRLELEKTSREVDAALSSKTREVSDALSAKVDELFGPDSGRVTKVLEQMFSDGSSSAVQHRVREAMVEVMAKAREDLLRQFSSGDASNPLADFKRASLALMRQAADQQDTNLRALNERLGALQLEVQRLQAERDKQLEVAAEQARGTAKGRRFEEAVADAIDAIARAQGDDCDAVGDERGGGGRTGDVVVAIEGCRGPARGRIVFEAKNARLSKKAALAELDDAKATRDADYAVLVVPSEAHLPARCQPLREFAGDKVFVPYDPEDGSRLALEVAYSLARARILMAHGNADGVDVGAVRAEVERALGAMEDVRRIKLHLGNATGGIEEARRALDALAAGVRAHLTQVETLLAAAGAAETAG